MGFLVPVFSPELVGGSRRRLRVGLTYREEEAKTQVYRVLLPRSTEPSENADEKVWVDRIWFPDWSKARFDKTSAQEGVDDEVG